MRSVPFILALAFSRAEADPVVRSWALLHSAAGSGGGGASVGEDFRRRGRIQLSIEEGGGSNNKNPEVKLELENDPDAMKGFNDQGWYRLKLVPEQTDSATLLRQDGIETTVPACQLRRANFRDELILMFGEAGQVLSMSYVPLVSPLAPKTCDELDPAPTHPELTSKISYEVPTAGMSLRNVLAGEKPPPGLKTITYKRNPNQQSTANNGASAGNPLLNDGANNGQPPPPPSGPFGFLSKYWYILLPVMLLNILMAPADPQQTASRDEGARPGGGRAAAPSSPRAVEGGSSSAPSRSPAAHSSAAAAAAAAPAAPGGSARQRRGKRG